MDDTFPKIEVLINNLYDLKQKRDGNFEASVQRVLNMLTVLEKGLWRTTRGNTSSFTDSQVEKCSLQLWNWVVAENTLSTISDIDNAKFRHVACKLLTLSDPSSINERRVRLQIEMCLNAAQAWIVCGRYEMTDDLFELARTCIEKLLDGLAGQHHSLSGSKRMMLDRDLFSIDGLQFQCVGSLGEHDKAVIAFNCVRDKLALHPKEAPFLAMVCYNLALKFHKEGKLEECTYWLRQSYDTGKAEEEYKVDSCQQAKTLRFLAHVCLQWEAPHCWINAVNAIELAIKEQPNVPGFLLYMKILTLSEAPDTDLISAVQEILKNNLPSDLVFNAVRMVMQNGRESACKACLPFVCESLSHTTCGLEVILLKMEVALHFGNDDEAKKEVEDLITKHHSGKMLKETQQEHMHLLLWGRASFHIEAKCYADALVWYELSASFYAPGKLDCNLAKLYRNLATCYLELHRLNKAKESLSKAHRIEPDNPTTIFLNLRVALFEGDEQNASHAMDCLVQLANQEKDSVGRLESLPAEDQETPADLLNLAVHVALEHKQQATAVKALEAIISTSSCTQKTLHALRCLLRLKMTEDGKLQGQSEIEIELSVGYLKTAYDMLQTSIDLDENIGGDKANDVIWFKKIAWNLALCCELWPQLMQTCFELSFKALKQKDLASLLSEKTCLVMMMACCLQQARKVYMIGEQEPHLQKVLELVAAYKEVNARLGTLNKETQHDPSHAIVLLYEFEVRLKLPACCPDGTLQDICELRGLEPAMLETAAALASEGPTNHPELAKKALSQALSLYLKKATLSDFKRCSAVLQHLVELCLPNSAPLTNPHLTDQAWLHYQDILLLLSEQPNAFLEPTVLWFLTRAWNCGVALAAGHCWDDAERWCSLAMQLGPYLSSLCQLYQTKLTSLHDQIMKRMDEMGRNQKHDL